VLPLPDAPGGHRLGVNGLAVDADGSTLYNPLACFSLPRLLRNLTVFRQSQRAASPTFGGVHLRRVLANSLCEGTRPVVMECCAPGTSI
jgi:hypothetical protein